MKLTIYTLRIISIFSILYFIAVATISGLKTSFLSFWIATSIISFLLSIFLPRLYKSQHMFSHRFGRIIIACFWLGMFCFLLIEGIILYHGKKAPEKNADYAIVLGAQVRGKIPSKTLYQRIKTAASYLLDNPNTKVICSGGQGSGEEISEALAIKQGLLSLGIEESRIILEDKSTNTLENLKNSLEIMNDANAKVVIITSDFHCFRSVMLAKNLGIHNVSSASAYEFLVTTIQYYVREFFALAKDFAFGNL